LLTAIVALPKNQIAIRTISGDSLLHSKFYTKKAASSTAFQFVTLLQFFFILSTASITFSRCPKAGSRNNLSLPGPKPEPGVPTALHSILRLSKREDFMFAPAETVLESTQKVNEALL